MMAVFNYYGSQIVADSDSDHELEVRVVPYQFEPLIDKSKPVDRKED